jgi:hypothetical protein
MKHISLSFAAVVAIACAAHSAPRSTSQPSLGQFSVSLAVKD